MEAILCHVGVSLDAFDAATLFWLAFEDYFEVVGVSDDDRAVEVTKDEGRRVFDESVV